MNQRLQDAIAKAQEAFWVTLATQFPEITSGDFPPDAQFTFNTACEEAAKVWVDGNSPVDDITNAIEALGFKLTSTGGGCEAWYLESGKHYVYLTATDGSTARGLTVEDDLWLGYYLIGQDHSDQIDLEEGKWETIRHRVDHFLSGEWAAEQVEELVKPWTNHYLCPCGEAWQDDADCTCNDRCPRCSKEIEPFISDDGSVTEEQVEAAWQATIKKLGLAVCDNCNRTFEVDRLQEPKNLDSRLEYPLDDPRCIVPDGECPMCGALCYIEPKPEAGAALETAVWTFDQIKAELAGVKTHEALVVLNSTVDRLFVGDRQRLTMTADDWFEWTELLVSKATELQTNLEPQHSPEPWSGATKSPEFDALVSADGKVIFRYTTDDQGLHFRPEDVRRILACVNGCAGIKTTYLEEILAGGGTIHAEVIKRITLTSNLIGLLERVARKVPGTAVAEEIAAHLEFIKQQKHKL